MGLLYKGRDAALRKSPPAWEKTDKRSQGLPDLRYLSACTEKRPSRREQVRRDSTKRGGVANSGLRPKRSQEPKEA